MTKLELRCLEETRQLYCRAGHGPAQLHCPSVVDLLFPKMILNWMVRSVHVGTLGVLQELGWCAVDGEQVPKQWFTTPSDTAAAQHNQHHATAITSDNDELIHIRHSSMTNSIGC